MTTNPPSSKTFPDMFDRAVIMDKILELLPLKDLLSCGQTCNELRTMCEYRFRQSYRKQVQQEVQIQLADSGKLIVSRLALNYLKYFDNIIENVTISSWNFKENENAKLTTLTNFLLKKCRQNLNKICIVGDIPLAPFGQQIESILRNVNAVEFANRRGAVDEAQFLRHCLNLKKLILGAEINNKNVDAILQQRYRRLTHFYYLNDDGTNMDAEKLQVFFRLNDQIQYVVWKFRIFESRARRNFVKCFQSLGYAENLKHFRICFAGLLGKYSSKQFGEICNQLNLLCKRATFQVLEIELIFSPLSNEDDRLTVVTRLNCFANWKQLTKLHLSYFEILFTIPKICDMVHLRSIVFNNCPLMHDKDEVVDKNATMEMPQIREVVMKSERQSDLTELCEPLVRHWKNLNTIVIPTTKYPIKLDVAELNRARVKLMDACELTIITNNKSLPTTLEHDLVKLRRDRNR